MTTATLMYKGDHLIEVVANSFRGLVHYPHDREHATWEYGFVLVDIVLELRVLHLDWQATGSGLSHWV